ncbi:hypothetical protein BC940DRAFT_332225 [Gongronella butleri]|nr:hypothetical protein BC940DRAFT_332225 [Gongronella butleri]
MQDIMENYSPPAGMDTVTYMIIWLTPIDLCCCAQCLRREILNKFTKMDSVIRETMRVRTAYIALPHVNVSNSTDVLSKCTKMAAVGDVYFPAQEGIPFPFGEFSIAPRKPVSE